MADIIIKKSGGVCEYYSPLLNERYFDYKHKSGVRVLLCPKDSAMIYAVLGTNFGAAVSGYRKDGRYRGIPAGTAHFLEHKMFDNPGGEKAADGFSELGADVNAFTSYDKTAFTFNTEEHFAECLEKLVYLVTHPYFTDETVVSEVPIIAQEIKMNADDSYEKCYMELIRGMYGRGRIRTDICGTDASIRKITPEMLYECHKLFYNPSNLVLSVCGNVSVDEINAALDKSVPSMHEAVHVTAEAYIGRAASMGKTVIRGNVSDSIFNIGICCNRGGNGFSRLERDTLLTLTTEAVMSESSDFYGRMIEEQIMTPEYSFGATVTDKLAYCSFSGETHSFGDVLDGWNSNLSEICRNGINLRDFERAKRVIYADYVTSFDSADDISLLMLSSAFDGIGAFDYLRAIENADLASADNVIRNEFIPDNTAYAVICPGKVE